MLFLLRFVHDGDNFGFSTEAMASSDENDNMLNKVEDILAATAHEHVVCQRCDEVIQEGCRSLSPQIVPKQDVGQMVLGRNEVITTTLAEQSRLEIQSEAIQGQRHGQVQVHRPLFADG